MQLHQSNLDFNDHIKVWQISTEMLKKSEEYSKSRMDYADAKYAFDLSVAKELPSLRLKKPNIGIETAQLMILEKEDEEIKDIYKQLIDSENTYKGLEKIIDALKTQITLSMSLIKNQTNQGAS